MASQSEIAERWAEQVGREYPRYIGTGYSSKIRVIGDHIYSYGSHFELARLVRSRGSRESGFFLLNGDRYSPSTNGHQAIVRAAVGRQCKPYDPNGISGFAIIPYSALNAAGIELDSIRLLEVQPDRVDRWTEDIGPAWELGDPRVMRPSERHTTIPRYIDGRWKHPEAIESAADVSAVTRIWRLNYGPGANVHAVETLRGYCHSNGRKVNYRPGENVSYYTSEGSGVEVIDGRFHVGRSRHFLGACVFTARVYGRKSRAKFLSAFDDQERNPLYFLCELPRCSARTYDEAIDALAPRIVHAALAQGRDVKRQGDIFAIPTELDRRTLRKRGAIFSKRSEGSATWSNGRWIPNGEGAKLLGTAHAATEVARVGRAVYARGMLYHDPEGWRDRDHARVKLGDGKAWHLVARNTVPQTRASLATVRPDI